MPNLSDTLAARLIPQIENSTARQQNMYINTAHELQNILPIWNRQNQEAMETGALYTKNNMDIPKYSDKRLQEWAEKGKVAAQSELSQEKRASDLKRELDSAETQRQRDQWEARMKELTAGVEGNLAEIQAKAAADAELEKLRGGNKTTIEKYRQQGYLTRDQERHLDRLSEINAKAKKQEELLNKTIMSKENKDYTASLIREEKNLLEESNDVSFMILPQTTREAKLRRLENLQRVIDSKVGTGISPTETPPSNVPPTGSTTETKTEIIKSSVPATVLQPYHIDTKDTTF